VATPLLKNSASAPAMQKEIDKTPVQRMADMEEIADAITFLVSPMSSYMYGAGLVVDG
jgi:NAD(P)-dependent dehydrogenase (short-subunit alcohol dehydrogenase family)